MTPYFTRENVRVAYETRFHFGWYAYGRQSIVPDVRLTLMESLHAVAERQTYHLLDFEAEPCVLRALLSLLPDASPSDVTRFVKGNLATAARTQHGIASLWSRGWFLRSVGHVTNETVRNYVSRQYDARNSPGGEPLRAAKACYANPGDPSLLRAVNHAKFEYNVHLVFVTSQRREFLDLDVAEALIGYLRRICDAKGWIAWNIEVVRNHLHMFVGLSPSDAPGEVALSFLNNAEHFMGRYSAALKDTAERTAWQPGYYVGTVGSATTAQVKAFLGGR